MGKLVSTNQTNVRSINVRTGVRPVNPEHKNSKRSEKNDQLANYCQQRTRLYFGIFKILILEMGSSWNTRPPKIILISNIRDLWNHNHNTEPTVKLFHAHYNTPSYEHLAPVAVQKPLLHQNIQLVDNVVNHYIQCIL